MPLFKTQTASFVKTVRKSLSQKFKMDSVTADLPILKTPEMSVQTIRIKSLTSVYS